MSNHIIDDLTRARPGTGTTGRGGAADPCHGVSATFLSRKRSVNDRAIYETVQDTIIFVRFRSPPEKSYACHGATTFVATFPTWSCNRSFKFVTFASTSGP